MNLNKKEPQIYIFTGHYGSGKTETAVNFALYLKKMSPERKVAIIDMDIVNPFFRTADAAKPLEDRGIRVELPLYAQSNVDVPALTPQMEYLIEEKDMDLVLDIGGDDVGAKAVGRYKEAIMKRKYNLFFVFNKNRPFTKDLNSSLKIYREIQESCGIDFTGIVNNTHLLECTTLDTLVQGIPLARELSQKTGVPLAFHCAFSKVLNNAEPQEIQSIQEPILPMEEYIKLLWPRGAF